jgi:hypothetical protein
MDCSSCSTTKQWKGNSANNGQDAAAFEGLWLSTQQLACHETASTKLLSQPTSMQTHCDEIRRHAEQTLQRWAALRCFVQSLCKAKARAVLCWRRYSCAALQHTA